MKTIELGLIKEIWKRKLTGHFDESKELFNVYVDSPFCFPPKCSFCIYRPNIIDNKTSENLKDTYYKKTLIENIREFKDVFETRKPNAVYFGGGTSSLMTCEQMERVFRELQGCFDFREVQEKHFEFNPISATDDKINLLLEWNFTHMTFGFQTCNQDVLKFNNRKNVSLNRMKEIFRKLEKHEIKYNIDLMTFIYEGNLDEDIQILKKDLKTVSCELNPKRITIFPNYKQFNNPFSDENIKNSIERIKRFREAVSDFVKNGGYTNIHKVTLSLDEKIIRKTLLTNPMLVRNDLSNQRWKIYSSTAPWNNPPQNQNVLALGGYGERKPYSYIPQKLIYNTINTDNGRIFELIFANIDY